MVVVAPPRPANAGPPAHRLPDGRPAGAARSLPTDVVPTGPISRLLIASFVLALAYYGYRYPLQYNLSGYGNVYKDTPPLLSAGKYVLHLGLLAAMVALLTAAGRRLVLSRSGLWLFVTAAVVAVMSVVNGGQGPALAVPLVFSLLCAGIVSIVVHTCPSAARSLWRVAGGLASAFVFVSTAANLVQMALYATSGRLPAHGYPGLVVRFGGYWDDPNQSAMFSAVVVVAVAAMARNLHRRPNRLLVVCGVFNVIVSVSYSGYLALAVGLLVVHLWGRAPTRQRRDRRIPWVVLVAGAAVAALTLLPVDLGPAQRAIDGKSESAKLRLSVVYRVEGRYFQLTDIPDPTETPSRLIGTLVRGDGGISSETSVVRLVLIGGVAPLVTLAVWLALAWRPALGVLGPWGLPVLLAFLAGSFFVPYLVIYPTGLFFFAGMEVAGALAASSSPTPVRSRGGSP